MTGVQARSGSDIEKLIKPIGQGLKSSWLATAQSKVQQLIETWPTNAVTALEDQNYLNTLHMGVFKCAAPIFRKNGG